MVIGGEMKQAEIGEVREFNGKKYVACKEGEEDECIGCAFYSSRCWFIADELGPCARKEPFIIFQEVEYV